MPRGKSQKSIALIDAAAPTFHESPIDRLLERLERVRQTGPGRWSAACPAHEDRSPSLSVRELEDGRILVHCFTGCPTFDVLAAVGLSFGDLYPEKPTAANPERRPFPAADVLRALYREILVVAAAAGFVLADRPLSTADRERLELAVERIQEAVSLSGVHRHG